MGYSISFFLEERFSNQPQTSHMLENASIHATPPYAIYKPPLQRHTTCSTQQWKTCVDSNNLWTVMTQEGLRDPAMVPPLSCTNISLPGELYFSQCYDICMCLYGMHGKVYSELEALTKFLLQLQAYGHTIQLLPWKVTEHNGNNPAIEISSIPNAFFDLHKYVPCLASLTASWTTRANLGCM